ncbi:MAG: hypothetical protein IPJ77_23065 [Planctomycetes bacterium]|nr:hypothetical protein [Planctomycetota bacterium]
MSKGTKEELAALEGRMRDLIRLLDGAQAGVDALERAWTACAEQGPAIERAARSAAAAAGEERAALKEQLQRLVELNAVARLSIEREEQRLAASFVRLRGTQATFEALGAAAVTGESCDVSG